MGERLHRKQEVGGSTPLVSMDLSLNVKTFFAILLILIITLYAIILSKFDTILAKEV